MLVTVLGSGTGIPVAHRGPSSIWVRDAGVSLLIDCGSGSVQKLHRAGGDVAELDAVLLTHAHPDHIGDLITLLFAVRLLERKAEPLHVYHAFDLSRVLDGLSDVFGDWLGLPGQVERHPIAADQRFQVGELAVEAFAVDHHETSLGYRLRDAAGASLAVPGDTGPSDRAAEAARGVDVLIVECAAVEGEPKDGHLMPSDVTAFARRADPGLVVLTHLYPESEDAGSVERVAEALDIPVIEAVDGLSLDVRPGEIRIGASEHAPPVYETTGSSLGAGSRSDAAARSDAEVFEALLEQDLANLDESRLSARKFQTGEEPTPGARGMHEPGPKGRRWAADDLEGLRPNRAQRRLVKRAEAQAGLPSVNLRGQRQSAALRELERSIERWRVQGVQLAQIITGKGKHSADQPVIKLSVLNWLDGAEGSRHVAEWAPQTNRTGGFGSLIVRLKPR